TQGNMPHEQVTIAEVLKDAGYFTAHVGKWHLGDAAHYPQTHGFDVNIGGTFWGAPTTFFYPYGGPSRWGGEFRYVPHLEFGHEGEYLTDRLTDEALQVMDKARDKPFFLNLCYHTVHTPIEGKPDQAGHAPSELRVCRDGPQSRRKRRPHPGQDRRTRHWRAHSRRILLRQRGLHQQV
ncbi:MAG: sulfatase-like hydrolase/transferase, partial [Planctomycetota bacterium]